MSETQLASHNTPKWFRAWGSTVYQEIISHSEIGRSSYTIATLNSDNGWKTYRGSEFAFEDKHNELLKELPEGHAVIHTQAVAEILKSLTTVSEDEESDILSLAKSIIEEHKDFLQKNKTPEVRGFFYCYNRVLGHKGWRSSVKTLVETTQLKAHNQYIQTWIKEHS